jgi:hypothetical protein
MVPALPEVPALNGHTDTVPDILGVAREVYPRYGFATPGTNEFGAAVSLD